jgi:hypothetical protein
MEAGMSWGTPKYTDEQRREIMRNARAAIASTDATLERAALSQRSSGIVHKTRDNARVEPEPESRETARSTKPVQPPEVAANETVVWWQWVQEHVDSSLAEFGEKVATSVAEFSVGYVADKVDPLKRELELLRRELAVVKTELNIRMLQDEVKAARAAIPSVAAFEEQLTAKQERLDKDQGQLAYELGELKNKFGKLRVDQSTTDYNLRQMRKQTGANNAASVEMEVETQSTHFQMRATHPAAARALRDFARQIIGNQDGTLLLSKPAGRA